MVTMRIREDDFRDNRKQAIQFRQVIVNREKSAYNVETTENYTVFNAKYFNTKTEVTNHFNFITDFQLSGKFGKLAGEIEYRKLFEDNRQVNLRFYAGAFLYNNTNLIISVLHLTVQQIICLIIITTVVQKTAVFSANSLF